jgi:hypothetical protein
LSTRQRATTAKTAAKIMTAIKKRDARTESTASTEAPPTSRIRARSSSPASRRLFSRISLRMRLRRRRRS